MKAKLVLPALVLFLSFTATAQQKQDAKVESKEIKKEAVPAAVTTHNHSHDGHSHDGHVHAAPATTETKEVVANPNAAKMNFKEETYDFKEVAEGPQVTHEFKFTNTGKEPLVLSNVRASCGCTTPSWPKEPILPGKDGTILVTYNTQGRPGVFTKSITINSNSDQPDKIIYIKGEVIKAEPEKSVPVETPSLLSPKN